MKVNFGNLTRDEQETKIEGESVEDKTRRNIIDVASRKNFILGDYVEKFEKAFAEYCGTKHCIGVSSGLAALELSLIGIGVGKGDEVVTVANTFNATVGGIAKTGAMTVLVDADWNNFNIDLLQSRAYTKKLSWKNRIKAIIPVHLYGQSIDMDRLMKENEAGIPIVEDACQAHGAYFNWKRVGSFGIAGCFSFYPGKNLGAYGDAGAVVTNDDNLADFVRKARNYGQTKKYHHDVHPDNARLDTIQAAVLVEKLKVLDKWNSMRASNADLYREKLKDVEEIALPSERKRGEHVYHLFVIKAKDNYGRDELEKHLGEKGVQTGLHYPVPIHLQPCFKSLGYKEGDFPVSERLSKEILTLPMFPTLREEEISYVADSIKEFYARWK